MSSVRGQRVRSKNKLQTAAEADAPGFGRGLRRRLIAWYRRNARDLPWRRTRDPYAIWISETMLQQTQVATVIPYFERFLAAFPTIATLAKAPEKAVLQLWEGLGYYRRARQLHRAAAVIVAEHRGEFPLELEHIQALPGIGRYTAGAIASFAFDQPAPIVEANTLRVYCRLLGFRGDPRSAAGQRLLWQTAREWLPRQGAGEFNQALMELGSTVCKIREPLCEKCPLGSICPTRVRGLQNEIPAAAPPKRFESITEAAVVIHHGQRVLLVQRDEGERWAGLWDFPRFELASKAGPARRRELQARIEEIPGLDARLGTMITTLKHGVTRFRITLECYEAHANGKSARSVKEGRWVKIADLDEYPMSATGRKLAVRLQADRL